VSDALWGQVEEVRRSKTRGGGPHRSGHVDLLGGLLECVCGRRLRSDGTFHDGRHRKLHLNPCPDWGSKARLGDETWETPILAQVSGITIDQVVIARVVAALGASQRPVSLDRARIERQMRDLAMEHVNGRIDDVAYLERLAQLRTDLESAGKTTKTQVAAERSVEWLRALGETWRTADLREAKADLLNAIYERIVVAGRSIVNVRLTPAAYNHGLAIALPEAVMARPEGVGRAITAYEIPIEGRDEWLAAARRLA